jgi:hypothetical protein
VAAAFAGKVVKVVRGRKHGDRSRVNELAPYRTGNGVIIQNPDGERQLYGHVTPAVKVGQQVAEGELVGHVDNSGNTTGPHVHYEEWTRTGATRDPMVSFRHFGVTPGKGIAPAEPKPAPKGLSIPGVTSRTYPYVQVAANAAALDKAWATFLYAYGFRTRYTKDRMRRWLTHWKTLSGYTGSGTAKAGDREQVKGMQRLLRNVTPRRYAGNIDGSRGPMTLAAEASYLNSYADDVRAIIKGD